MGTTQRWQDWASFSLGLWLAVSPWILGYLSHEAATANAAFVGLALALGAHYEVSCDAVSAEWLNVAGGAWLVAAPFVLGFQGIADAAANSVVVGVFTVALAASAMSLDKDLARLLQRAFADR